MKIDSCESQALQKRHPNVLSQKLLNGERHSGLEEPAPCMIRGNPDVVPTKVGTHLKYWIPVFTGNPGFPLEYTPYPDTGRE
jgi:hypothetical protein